MKRIKDKWELSEIGVAMEHTNSNTEQKWNLLNFSCQSKKMRISSEINEKTIKTAFSKALGLWCQKHFLLVSKCFDIKDKTTLEHQHNLIYCGKYPGSMQYYTKGVDISNNSAEDFSFSKHE